MSGTQEARPDPKKINVIESTVTDFLPRLYHRLDVDLLSFSISFDSTLDSEGRLVGDKILASGRPITLYSFDEKP